MLAARRVCAAPDKKGDRVSRFLAGCLAVLLLCAPAVRAQEKKKGSDNTRNVKGMVQSPEGAGVKQAVVYLKNTKTLQVNSFITKDDGTYSFHELNPDIDYELRAEATGLSSPARTLSSFDTRKEAVIDLKLVNKK
jgi:hypothetical protein